MAGEGPPPATRGCAQPSAAWRCRCLAAPLLMWQTALLTSIMVLLPASLLLLVPLASARGAFLWVARQCQAVWLGMAVALVRHVLGVKIVLYAGAEVHDLAEQDILIISNHRTRVDWMFFWALAAALGRLGSLNIVLKDSLRSVPGFGWATQCFGYAFMSRQGRSQTSAPCAGRPRCTGGAAASRCCSSPRARTSPRTTGAGAAPSRRRTGCRSTRRSCTPGPLGSSRSASPSASWRGRTVQPCPGCST
ncbi:unnamed protein product [Prorocentrum cordatum]|uniref:Phospholipid/glycerol acyltransferase domain-containing protein n=1 Tax=Prorocentrum cordatum TaxID=2364126 RepID=A0ABN9YKP4_9DINO|nr:unnamed protein product [Polarella glacialis]